jgi:class 3 adenylate cyclase
VAGVFTPRLRHEVAHEDDAVRAALAMHAAMQERESEVRRLLGQPVRLRIRIHTGIVVWGSRHCAARRRLSRTIGDTGRWPGGHH